MVEVVLPLAVQQFLLTRIESIAQLEALLLLYRDPSQAWDCTEISRRLYIDEAVCAELLQGLKRQGLVVKKDARYSFYCDPAELESTVQLVQAHYTKHLIPVTNLIHSKLNRIQEFANAFKIKKER
jgi:predicted transcriptional regulator